MSLPHLAISPSQSDLVIFDCDGVLIDSEWIACQVEAEVLREDGFDIDAAAVRRLLLGLTPGSISLVTELGTSFGDTLRASIDGSSSSTPARPE